jgi:hypothetical protein
MTTCKLKLPQPTEGGADQTAASERQQEKTKTKQNKNTAQPPKLQQSFGLNTYIRTGC